MRLDRLYGREVKIEAKYAAYWAPAFLGFDDGTITEIPFFGSAVLDRKGAFTLAIPDLSTDRLVATMDRSPEISLWAREQASSAIVAQLRPSAKESTIGSIRLGRIPIGSLSTSPPVFVPCAANPPAAHDQYGFGIRPDAEDACN
jgi:hypothetical protein